MILFLLFILGLCVGSFLNVLIDRIPREESIKGRSYCESCKHVLSWHDLIPLLSFVQLKGKCRYCGSTLSFYYPVVELVTGVFFVIIYFTFLQTSNLSFMIYDLLFITKAFYYLLIVCSLIVIFFADLKYGIIPDKILVPIIVITVIKNVILACPESQKILDAVACGDLTRMTISGVGAFLFFLLLFLGTKGRGMGFGDVKFSFFMGLFLGFPKIVFALYTAFLTGALISIILLIGGKKKLKSTIPFGPFLVIGTLVAWMWGEKIMTIFRFL